MKTKLCACICVHDDTEHLSRTLSALGNLAIVLVVSRVDWKGATGDGWKEAARIGESHGAQVILGEWSPEEPHRLAAYEKLQELGYTHAIIPDGDEIIEPGLLDTLKRIAEQDLADRVYVEWDTYWSDIAHVVRPREPFTPCMMIKLGSARYRRVREFDGGRSLFLNETHGIVHHLSYVGPDERIAKKITTWGHKDEVRQGWYERFWRGWKVDPLITNLHPTHPESYRFIEHISPPAILGGEVTEAVTNTELWPEGLDPKVSICIPLYGGEGFIEQTLDALERCRDLIHDVVIVDNASPDAAANHVEKRPWITLIRNEENRGFAIASNQAYRASTGETIIFLNSDALVTRAGLIELVVALYRSGSVGAAAPLTNFACTEQAIAPCFSHLDNLERFASDVARREVDDTDSDFVIGFCVALRRKTLEELGPFDERFETGGAEDLELSYRLRRSGYRVMVAQRSYIHHLGSLWRVPFSLIFPRVRKVHQLELVTPL